MKTKSNKKLTKHQRKMEKAISYVEQDQRDWVYAFEGMMSDLFARVLALEDKPEKDTD